MPFISTPTETVRSLNNRVASAKEAVITSASGIPVGDPGATNYVLGIDTCGFTSGSTITCSFGNACTNVGNYRGCCVPGAADCVETIYTGCVDYGNANAAQCGPHTLCCPATMAYCFSYGFTTENQPGATFTHVQCQPSNGFGEMFPYPPELYTTIDPEASSASANASDLVVDPTESNTPTSSTSPGAIAGAIVGVIAFLILAIVAACLIIRRRRQQRRDDVIANTLTAANTDEDTFQLKRDSSTGTLPRQKGGGGRTRPLSTIQEQPSPSTSPRAAVKGHHQKSGTAIARSGSHSFGSNWPLNSPNGNPLTAHPVDLEKRLSWNGDKSTLPGGIPAGSGVMNRKPVGAAVTAKQNANVPIIQVPTPPPPGTRFVAPKPLPPTPEHPRSARTSVSNQTRPSSLQSPRLSYAPGSPINFGFTDELDKSTSASRHSVDFRGSTVNGGVSPATGSNAALVPSANHPNPQTQGNPISMPRAAAADSEPDPVSPLDSDDDDFVNGVHGSNQRISLVSAPSAPGEQDRHLEDLVSPVSPEDDDEDDENGNGNGHVRRGGTESPDPVSPLESRRGSLDH